MEDNDKLGNEDPGNAGESADKSVTDPEGAGATTGTGDGTDSGAGAEQGTEGIEKTPITDEMREKMNIPQKFKYLEDVVKWGSEAEKAKSRAESSKAQVEAEKIRYERDLEIREEMIAGLKKDLKEKVKSGEMTPEEEEEINEKLRADMTANPAATMRKLFQAFKDELKNEQESSSVKENWKKEEAELKSKYPDNWDSEIKPALVKITAQRPYLRSISEALAIYEHEKSEADKTNKAEAETKKTEKKAAFVETGAGAGGATGDIYAKIAAAKTEDELEKLTAKLPRATRE